MEFRSTYNLAVGNTSATRVGLAGYLASAARFDNLVVTQLPPLPDLSVTLAGPTTAPLLEAHLPVGQPPFATTQPSRLKLLKWF